MWFEARCFRCFFHYFHFFFSFCFVHLKIEYRNKLVFFRWSNQEKNTTTTTTIKEEKEIMFVIVVFVFCLVSFCNAYYYFGRFGGPATI